MDTEDIFREASTLETTNTDKESYNMHKPEMGVLHRLKATALLYSLPPNF